MKRLAAIKDNLETCYAEVDRESRQVELKSRFISFEEAAEFARQLLDAIEDSIEVRAEMKSCCEFDGKTGEGVGLSKSLSERLREEMMRESFVIKRSRPSSGGKR